MAGKRSETELAASVLKKKRKKKEEGKLFVYFMYVASKKRTSSKIRAFCLVQLKKNVLFNLLCVLDLYTKGPARREGHTVRAKHIRHQLTSPVYRSRLHEEWPRLNTALGTSK